MAAPHGFAGLSLSEPPSNASEVPWQAVITQSVPSNPEYGNAIRHEAGSQDIST